MGKYFIPDFISPFLIIAIIIDEKKEVMHIETTENIIKSVFEIPELEKLTATPAPDEGILTFDIIDVTVVSSCVESPNNNGAPSTAAIEINIT